MPDMTVLSGELDETHWSPAKGTDWSGLEQAALVVDQFENGMQYWIGDMLIYAEQHFPEHWTQLVPEGKAETWRGYKWVAERVSPAIRRQLSGYSQAKLIAKMDLPEQEAVCKEHEPASLTKRELQEKLRNTSGKAEENPGNTQGISEPWTKPQLTWGQLKALIDDDELIEDDTPICLNVGPDAVDVAIEMQPEDDYQSRYVEGRAKDRAAAKWS